MSNLLLKNAAIACFDKKKTYFPKGDILIKDNIIQEFGPNIPVPEHVDRIIDCSAHLVMPGFVNTHSHIQQYMRGLYELIGEFYNVNLPLERYRQDEDMEYLGLSSLAEYIYGGCTTALMTFTYPDGVARAAEKVGNRAFIAGDIEETDLVELQKTGKYVFLNDKGSAAFHRATKLYDDWHMKANGRITVLMCPKATDLCRTETYLKVKQFAKERDLYITTHLSQKSREYDMSLAKNGVTPTRHLKNIGLLDEKLLAVHCPFITTEDEMLIADSGAAIMQSTVIRAPYRRWQALGIPIGVGTDDYYMDMPAYLKRLRQAQIQQASITPGLEQYLASDPFTTKPSPYDLFELGTRLSAEAIGKGSEIGSIEKGKKADLIAFDTVNPLIRPTNDLLTSVILYGTSSDIDLVIIDGTVVKEGKELTTINIREALKKGQERIEEIRQKFFHDYPVQAERFRKSLSYISGTEDAI